MYSTAQILVSMYIKDELSLDASPETNAARAIAALMRLLPAEQQERVKKAVSEEYSRQLLAQVAALRQG